MVGELKPGAFESDGFMRYIDIKGREARWGLLWLRQISIGANSILRQLNDELDDVDLEDSMF